MRAVIQANRVVWAAACAVLVCGGVAAGIEFGAGAGPGMPNMSTRKKMDVEVERVVTEYRLRGANLTGKSGGSSGGNLNCVTVLKFGSTADTTPVDKSILLERISSAFVIDANADRQAMLRLVIQDGAGFSRIVTLKYPDRVVSLLDDGGTWTLRVDQAPGKPGHKAEVTDHDKGKDVPPAHRRDFVEAAKLLATLNEDALPSQKKFPGGAAFKDFRAPAAAR